MKEKKELERQVTESKTLSVQSELEKTVLVKKTEQLQNELDYILQNGIDKIKKKAEVWDQLDYYLKNHPDREQAKLLSCQLNQCIQYAQKELEK